MKLNEIVVLCYRDCDENSFHIIHEENLKHWMEDGSIIEGDKIVYPNKIMNVVLEKKLELCGAVHAVKDGGSK